MDKVVDAISEPAKDLTSEERAVALFGSGGEFVVELVGEPPCIVLFHHAARVAARAAANFAGVRVTLVTLMVTLSRRCTAAPEHE